MSSEARFRSITYAVGAWIVFAVLAHFLPPDFGTISSGLIQTGILVVLAIVFYFCIQGLVKNSQPEVRTKEVEKEKVVYELSSEQEDKLDKLHVIVNRMDLDGKLGSGIGNVLTDEEADRVAYRSRQCKKLCCELKEFENHDYEDVEIENLS